MKCPICGNNPYDNLSFKVEVKRLVDAIKAFRQPDTFMVSVQTLKERSDQVGQALAAVEEVLK